MGSCRWGGLRALRWWWLAFRAARREEAIFIVLCEEEDGLRGFLWESSFRRTAERVASALRHDVLLEARLLLLRGPSASLGLGDVAVISVA